MWKRKKELKIGTLRVRKKFAFIPVKIDDLCFWFETYFVKEEYQSRTIRNLIKAPEWTIIDRWIEGPHGRLQTKIYERENL
jgi:hypothetical protein